MKKFRYFLNKENQSILTVASFLGESMSEMHITDVMPKSAYFNN